MKEKIRVLVVEDEFLVGEMIAQLLSDLGYEIAGRAMNGLEAVQLTATLQPDVVLMDIEMPGMSGIEACQHIQDDNPVPVVMMTAYENPDMVNRASDAGAGAYLVKPPNPGEIERAILISRARFHDMQELRRLNNELQSRNREMESLIAELRDALGHVRTLRRLLPICAACKKIRDDQGYWHMVEDYLSSNTDLVFSHGLCPECMQKYYPDFLPDGPLPDNGGAL